MPHLPGRQQLLQFLLIEADHNLAVNNSHRGSHNPNFDQLLHSRLIGDNVLFLEVNPPLRKKLFRPSTEGSTRLRIHDNFFAPPVTSKLGYLLNYLAGQDPLCVLREYQAR